MYRFRTGGISYSRDKMDSNFASVREQSGIFAGSGGFDVTVGGHTQLDGGAMASAATADKNRLDTGTLGWRDIHNTAEYSVEHHSAGISTGGSAGERRACGCRGCRRRRAGGHARAGDVRMGAV
ncbi:hypothetical protein L8P07_20250 [Enterobacter roggenkampii]|nr:hypothetical protein [Enterobacter roggenkampii]MCK7444709.1 hypothetical protein [Enterobacter roggenkampii]